MSSMRSTTVYEPDRQLNEPPANLEIVNWPLRDNPATCILLILLVLLGASCITIASNNLVVGLVGFSACAVTLRRMWIPVQYEFGPKGVIETVYGRSRRTPWSSIRVGEIRGDGVFLDRTSETTPLSALRGHYIRWGENKAELIGLLNYYLGPRMANS